MNQEQKIKVAVVGSGPAGFYAAGHLLAEGPEGLSVDMFERLPTPWGLVRFGVAPDHPKIKTVSRVYEKTAEHPRFRFFGNVEVGRDLTVEELAARYHAVVFAIGTAADRALGIPGEDLPGSIAATEFVAWYNAHPDHARLAVDLSPARAVVVGNGNVALDVARILVTPVELLAKTDIADHALEALRRSGIEEVVVVGRRGPGQAAFTNPELKELGEIDGVSVVVDRAELEEALNQAPADLGQTARRNVEILRSFADRQPQEGTRRIVFSFLRSPIELRGQGRVEEVVLVRNRLVVGEHNQVKAEPTAQTETLPAGLVVRAIGYRGTPLPGLPFDSRAGLIPNAQGRVIDPENATPVPGLYVVGWIKRGPTGVIGTNKKDAQETVDALLEDVAAGRLPDTEQDDPIEDLLARRGVQVVDYSGWRAIDRHEQARGKAEGRPRNKLATLEELLAVAAGAQTVAEVAAAESTLR